MARRSNRAGHRELPVLSLAVIHHRDRAWNFLALPGLIPRLPKEAKDVKQNRKAVPEDGGDIRRTELAIVIALLAALAAGTIMTDSYKRDSSPTAVGTTIQW
jgi:hypothetical protein